MSYKFQTVSCKDNPYDYSILLLTSEAAFLGCEMSVLRCENATNCIRNFAIAAKVDTGNFKLDCCH